MKDAMTEAFDRLARQSTCEHLAWSDPPLKVWLGLKNRAEAWYRVECVDCGRGMARKSLNELYAALAFDERPD